MGRGAIHWGDSCKKGATGFLSRGSVSVCEGSGKYDKSSLQGSAGFYWGLEKGSTKIL